MIRLAVVFVRAFCGVVAFLCLLEMEHRRDRRAVRTREPGRPERR